MALAPTKARDVVPGRGLVAEVALVDLCLRLSGDHGANLVEMLSHVVARRSLMALGAVRRAGRWVPELRDGPPRRRVALGAVLPEELVVPILGGVACGTVQHRFERGDVRVTAARLPAVDPGNELLPDQCVLGVQAVLVSGLYRSWLGDIFLVYSCHTP